LLKVISCLAVQHDFRFVLVAAVVCLLASATAFWLHARAVAPKGLSRSYWLALTGMACGSGVWATHFIAMLAYQPGFETGYLPLGTFGSLLIAMGVAAAGFAIATAPSLNRLQRVGLGGLALGGGIAAMHYFGMASFRTQGEVTWDRAYVAASVILGVTLATVALHVARDGRTVGRRLAAAGLLTVAICALHFTGMAAVTITPDPTVVVPTSVLSSGVMVAIVAILALAFIAAAAWTVRIDASSRRGALVTLRTAIDAMPDGLAYFDPHGRCLVWNRRYAELAPSGPWLTDGFTMEDVLRAGLADGRYPEAIGREQAWLAALLVQLDGSTSPFEYQLSDGTWMRFEQRKMADGGTLIVSADITEFRARAETLARAKADAEAANRAKSEFLANMSHEIRTPLNGVVAVADTLCRRNLAPEEREMAELIRSSGQTLELLLSDILDLAKIESGRLSIEAASFHLADLVRSAATLAQFAAAEKGLAFRLEIAPDLEQTVLGDPVRVRQVLTNLLSNAVKFTAKGQVAITASRSNDARVRIEVADTGVGFDTADYDQIFGRFQQADGSIVRRFGGAGLGLSISRTLAELMGGILDGNGAPGEGARFWLELPLEPHQGAVVVTEATGEISLDRPLRILLADDHPTNRKVVRLLLSAAAVDIVEAEDGAQALAALDQGRFDVVLMDMQMPVMDGLTAVREIRRREAGDGRAAMPIIMLTANALAEHVEQAAAAGANLHLTKPVKAAGLFAAIDQVLSDEDRMVEIAAA
jgi:signal transduction histidine kinase/ActR/RegA family two-component response regulator